MGGKAARCSALGAVMSEPARLATTLETEMLREEKSGEAEEEEARRRRRFAA